jgi:alkanesulfonate monooxygenase
MGAEMMRAEMMGAGMMRADIVIPNGTAAVPARSDASVERRLRAKVYATCPPSTSHPENYLEHVAEIARWSDRAGCTGILIYTDNSLVDPWLVAQVILANTQALTPLVAVQPVYMHPYAVAKMVTSLGFMYDRRVDLNLVAGGFKNDLAALNDTTPHDLRYERLIEYTTIIRRLLQGGPAVTQEGAFYSVTNLSLSPELAPGLFPRILISGSSAAGLDAAKAIGGIPVKYPEPPDQYRDYAQGCENGYGIRVGIIARETEAAAWDIADQRFPDNRKGQLLHQLAMRTSDSAWHKRLSEIGGQSERRGVYWLHPFENYQTFCPYLVGSYETVASALAAYRTDDETVFLLDVPPSEHEFEHIEAVLALAAAKEAA